MLPRVKRHFRNAIVRGDTDFDRSDIFNAVIGERAYFAIGGRLYPNRAALVGAIAEPDWKPFFPRAERAERGGPSRHVYTRNWRRQKAAERGFRRLRTVKQWLSEIDYQPHGLDSPCRMIVRRVLIEETDGQGALFTHFRYRLVLTNLARSYTAQQVVDLTYQRCDQENVIEQFGQGIAGWRMPVAELWATRHGFRSRGWLGISASGLPSSLCRARWCARSGNAFAATLSISLPRS